MTQSMKNLIIDFSIKQLGFDECRFTSAYLDDIDSYKEWLSNNYHGSMGYLKKHLPLKEDPTKVLDNVQSAIVVIKNYKNTTKQFLDDEQKVARYALGHDYHDVIMKKLENIISFIKKYDSSINCYPSVDRRPVAERCLALQAGIGFRGKNTLVIHPTLGSYFFIGVILTTYDFKIDTPLHMHCGNCRKCIDACPTGALTNDTFDARKCISYLTTHRKKPLLEKELKTFNGWIYGCDCCQEVCPYNSDTPLTDWKEFWPVKSKKERDCFGHFVPSQ
ncbi:tRNA epoxyqueuosine(34) reductase QueG [Candidatus Margulisiibacteriota bacterium]